MSTELPFQLTQTSASQWLSSLMQLNSAKSANQLNQVIKKFREPSASSDLVLQTLILFTPKILSISTAIESSLLSQNNKSTNFNSRKIEKLCIQLLRNAGLAFCTLAKEKSLSIDEQQQAIYFAFQFIGLAQRSAAIFRESPSFSLWKSTAKLYKLALANKIFSSTVNHKVQNFKNQLNIEAIFKRNLLFTILEPYRYSSDDIRELFKLSDQQSDSLSLKKETSNLNCFQWDSDSEMPPCPQNYNQHNIDFDINIDTTKFLAYLKSAEFPYNLEKETLAHITNHISGYKEIIDSSTPSIPEINNIIIGFSAIVNFLEKVSKLNKIKQLSSELPDTQNTEDLSFGFLESNQRSLGHQSSLSSSKGNNDLLRATKAVKIIQTNNNHYFIAETNPINCSIGDIVLLCTSDLKSELGIIRQVKITNQSGTTHLLIEKIEGTPSFHLFVTHKSTEKPIIILDKKFSNAELFIAPCKFANGTQLTSTTDQSFTLEKVVDYSPSFMHYLTS